MPVAHSITQNSVPSGSLVLHLLHILPKGEIKVLLPYLSLCCRTNSIYTRMQWGMQWGMSGPTEISSICHSIVLELLKMLTRCWYLQMLINKFVQLTKPVKYVILKTIIRYKMQWENVIKKSSTLEEKKTPHKPVVLYKLSYQKMGARFHFVRSRPIYSNLVN